MGIKKQGAIQCRKAGGCHSVFCYESAFGCGLFFKTGKKLFEI